MKNKPIEEKGVLAKLLEQAIKILIKKECKEIGNFKIDIIASSIQIIKGIINKILIQAEDINYKDLLFNKVEIEANNIKITFKTSNRKLKIKNNSIINFKLSLSENSLRSILSSNNWTWISDKISNKILNQNKLEDLKIKNNQILIKTTLNKENLDNGEKIEIKIENDKLLLENKAYNKSFIIPIEDKVLIKDVNIKNNIINILATSPISFE